MGAGVDTAINHPNPSLETGTIAAAYGGTTTIIDFATQSRGGSLTAALDQWHAKAAGRALADYAFHMAITDMSAAAGRDMARMVREGVTSFKLYMAYPGVLMSDDAAVLRALQRSNEVGALVGLHCENGAAIAELVRQARAQGHTETRWHALTRPPEAEAEAVRRAAALASMAGAPVYVVHLSSAAGLEEVRRARLRGVPVLAETCPQYLYLDAQEYERPAASAVNFVIAPPLRAKSNQDALWQALAGGEFQAVATDHVHSPGARGPASPARTAA